MKEIFTVFRKKEAWGHMLLSAVVFFAIKKFKKHPIVYIAISAVVGILLAF